MSKINGQNLRVFIGGAVVAEATNCQIQLTNNMEDSSTKDSVGMFNQETIATKSWQITIDTLNVTNIGTLLGYWKNHTALTVKWDVTETDDNVTAAGADLARTGTAILTDASFQFNDRQNVATNVTLTGTGAITTVS